MKTIIGIVVGAVTGLLSGMGIGGGSLLILYLTAFAGTNQYAAGGINLLYFLCCAPTALISHIRCRRVEWAAVWRCFVSGVPTSLGCAWLASLLPADWLRRLFGLFLLYIGFRELFRKAPKKAV